MHSNSQRRTKDLRIHYYKFPNFTRIHFCFRYPNQWKKGVYKYGFPIFVYLILCILPTSKGSNARIKHEDVIIPQNDGNLFQLLSQNNLSELIVRMMLKMKFWSVFLNLFFFLSLLISYINNNVKTCFYLR